MNGILIAEAIISDIGWAKAIPVKPKSVKLKINNVGIKIAPLLKVARIDAIKFFSNTLK